MPNIPKIEESKLEQLKKKDFQKYIFLNKALNFGLRLALINLQQNIKKEIQTSISVDEILILQNHLADNYLYISNLKNSDTRPKLLIDIDSSGFFLNYQLTKK